MKQMKLYGMHNAFKTAIESAKTDHYTLDQFVSMLLMPNGMKGTIGVLPAVSPTPDSITSQILKISILTKPVIWIETPYCVWQNVNLSKKNKNILITGSTGVGKSYLGTALGYQACMEGFKVSYFNTSKLFAKLKMA
jgi:hypothetical protein